MSNEIDAKTLTEVLSEGLLETGVLDQDLRDSVEAMSSYLAIQDRPDDLYDLISNLWFSSPVADETLKTYSTGLCKRLIENCSPCSSDEIQYVIGDAIAHLAVNKTDFEQLCAESHLRGLTIASDIAISTRAMLFRK